MLLLVKSFLRCCTECRFKISLFFLWNQEPICELQEAFGNVKIVTSFEWNPLQAPSSAASPCELVSWASRELGLVIQIFFKSLTGNFLLRAIPYSATCHHLRRAPNGDTGHHLDPHHQHHHNKAIIQETSWGGRGHNYTDWQPAYVLPAPPLDQPSCSHFFKIKNLKVLPWTNYPAPIFKRWIKE